MHSRRKNKWLMEISQEHVFPNPFELDFQELSPPWSSDTWDDFIYD